MQTLSTYYPIILALKLWPLHLGISVKLALRDFPNVVFVCYYGHSEA